MNENDFTSYCLMNAACLMERQMLCMLEASHLLSFKGLSIYTCTHTQVEMITSKQEVTHIKDMSATTVNLIVFV